ncbi:probable serine/threonine-protein kinase At1g09600 [Arachis duranensis]|uniref:Probable serine/threonine-protein kinase At1g09600 n=1 Tax=Arachis duranensis TaxID=130453 RepID=A0A6P4DH54_ARADU|nr:probable serine/threonine-protein kinase At1g09600 [Arachis duranensis]
MGCICSKEKDRIDDEEKKEKGINKNGALQIEIVPPSVSTTNTFPTAQLGGVHGLMVPHLVKSYAQVAMPAILEDKTNDLLLDTAKQKQQKRQHQRCKTVGSGENGGIAANKSVMRRLLSLSHISGENIDAGWPTWLSSVAGEAIKGWLPRRADSFEKLEQIGQGAYSSVHKALDLESGKFVALKKVRFLSSDLASVRFMAREIHILRQLNHPNVIKLEGLVASRTSSSLYLVFEYMEHDLAGLAATPGIKFTEPQIKCFMQQLLRGLEHCHSRGVLHRDIKGSNLLIDNNGNLKIGDFGLATVYDPEKNQQLTSRVVTLWYRAPELLLGATEYGAAIDMWSAGCILAELLLGKPIMPGRTEVEQMHKIFKLCGSPSEEYWQRTKFPHATSFKPQQHYERQIAKTFRKVSSSALALVDKLLSMEPEDRGSATCALQSEFFTTEPLPCDPSSLPKFPPTKEFDAKNRNKEVATKNTEAVRERRLVSELSDAGQDKKLPRTPEYNTRGDLTLRGKPNGEAHYKVDPSRSVCNPSYVHSTTMNSAAITRQSKFKRLDSSVAKTPELRTQKSQISRATADFSNYSSKWEQGAMPGHQEPMMEYVQKKSRIHCSGPLMPPGGNIDDMLREHEKLMQEAFRTVKINSRN